MSALGSLAIVAMVAGIHLTIGHWHWLHRREANPWLSASAGTAVAYVFVYLLPKLAATQAKLDVILPQWWTPILRNQIYLLALAGLLVFFWLAWIDAVIERREEILHQQTRSRLVLHIVGYGLYSLLIGMLLASLEGAGLLVHILAGAVIGMHMMGVDHGVYEGNPRGYERTLRWVFTAAVFGGWTLGIVTDRLETLFMLVNAFIGGGILITAIREELPAEKETRFLPFLAGVICASAAILTVQIIVAQAAT